MDNKILDAAKDFVKTVSIIISNSKDDTKTDNDNKIDTKIKINDKIVFDDKI